MRYAIESTAGAATIVADLGVLRRKGVGADRADRSIVGRSLGSPGDGSARQRDQAPGRTNVRMLSPRPSYGRQTLHVRLGNPLVHADSDELLVEVLVHHHR